MYLDYVIRHCAHYLRHDSCSELQLLETAIVFFLWPETMKGYHLISTTNETLMFEEPVVSIMMKNMETLNRPTAY